jgi:hypothetical protein
MIRQLTCILISTLPAFAQCSMCRASASAQGAEASAAFDKAIVILLAPALILFSGVFLFVFHREGPARDSEDHERTPGG